MKAWQTILIIVIVVLALFIYQSIAYSPQNVIKSMQKKIVNTKTCHYVGNILMEGEARGTPGSIKINIEADADASDKDKPKFLAVIDGAFQTEGIQFSAAVEMKSFKDYAYFRLIKFPAIPGKFSLPEAEKYKNQWIKIPLDKYSKFKVDKEKSKAIQEELKKWMKESKPFSNIEKLGFETIGGKKCFHYGVTLNKEAIVDLIQRMNKVTEKETNPEDMDKLKEELGKLGELKGEIWIGKKDRLLYKVKTSTEIAPEEIQGKINLVVEITFSEYNKPLDIQEPTEAIDFDKIMAEIMQSKLKAKPGVKTTPGMPPMPPQGFPVPPVPGNLSPSPR